MKDLEDPRWMYLKVALFLVIGATCFILVLLDPPKPLAALFMLFMIWAFARTYYFAFYVIEKYIDPSYRFSGLISCARWLLASRRRSVGGEQAPAVTAPGASPPPCPGSPGTPARDPTEP
jgi:hypothetical protein